MNLTVAEAIECYARAEAAGLAIPIQLMDPHNHPTVLGLITLKAAIRVVGTHGGGRYGLPQKYRAIVEAHEAFLALGGQVAQEQAPEDD
jgi:hypothetical protein